MAPVGGTPSAIWVFRKGNGQLRVHPSPVVLVSGQVFRIANLTGVQAQVDFPESTVVDAKTGETCIVIPGAYSPDLTVVGRGASYFEYDVQAGGNYADGGSKPGGIIDP